jgi:DNA-binding transcriptional regulator YiaG
MEKDIFKEVKLKADSRPRKRKIEWDDPAEVMFHMKEMRSGERRRILDQLVPKRYCPECGRLKINSASWVISKDHTKAICRSCFQRIVPDKELEQSSKLEMRVFTSETVRYIVSAQTITRAREKISISRREFARQCGWSASYQQKLEEGRVLTVSAESAQTILEVIRRFGFYTDDNL